MEILNLVSKYHKNVTFIWIPSHVGIKGHESVDRLANSAALKTTIDVDV